MRTQLDVVSEVEKRVERNDLGIRLKNRLCPVNEPQRRKRGNPCKRQGADQS